MTKKRSDYSRLSPTERKRRKALVKKAYRAVNRERLNALRKKLRDERMQAKNAAWVNRRDATIQKRLTAEERLGAHVELQRRWLAMRDDPPDIPQSRLDAVAERTRLLQKLWRAQNPDKCREYARRRRAKDPHHKQRWDEEHPEIAAARQAARDAVKAGYLIRQPCVVCGGVDNIEGHHPDYDRPLEVVWLCAPCHRDEHARLRKLEAAKPQDGLFD
jgi:hypothetical protein